MNVLLKEYIQLLLKKEETAVLVNEEAINLGSAVKNGYALFAEETSSGEMAFVLLNAEAVNNKVPVLTYSRWAGSTHLSLDDFAGYILLSSETLESCRAWMVQQSSATKGLGPLMYDIAMSWAHKQGRFGLVSDRHSVSNSALKIWQHYNAHRKDVSQTSIDTDNNVCIVKTRSVKQNTLPTDEDNILNKVYYTDHPLNYEGLISNGYKLINALQKKGYSVTPEQIIRKAEEWFWQKF